MTGAPSKGSPQAHIPFHYEAFKLLVQENKSGLLHTVMAYGLYMESEGRWLGSLKHEPSVEEQRHYHEAACTEHYIKKINGEAKRLIEEFGDNLVRSHTERFLEDAIEKAVSSSHRSKKAFWLGVAEATIGAFVWTTIMFVISIVAQRAGIDLLAVYREVSGK